jgi:hypothetical protein
LLRLQTNDGGNLTNLQSSSLVGALPAISGAALTGLPSTNVISPPLLKLQTNDAGSLTNLQSSSLVGALPAISGAALTGLPSTNVISPPLLQLQTNDASSLTNLNFGQAGTGTVPDARLGANLAAWDAIPTTQFINTNLGAAKGDLAVFDGANWVRIAAGSDGQFLMASNATATGLAYSTAAGGGGSLATNYYIFATNAARHDVEPPTYTQVDGLSLTFYLPVARDVTISFSIVSTKNSGFEFYQIFDGTTAIAPGNGSLSWFSVPGTPATGSTLYQTELTASTMLNLAAGWHTNKVMFQYGAVSYGSTFYDRSLQVSVH